MNTIRTAKRCVACNAECQNRMRDMPLVIICENPECPNYWLMQVGKDAMDMIVRINRLR